MKRLKKFIIFLLNVILIDLLLLLIINCTIKDYLFDDLLVESFTSKNQDTYVDESKIQSIKEQVPVISNDEIIEEMLKDEEVRSLIEEYTEEIMKNISNDEDPNIDAKELEIKMLDYIKENKEELSEKTGIEITDEMIERTKEQLDEDEINSNLVEEVNKIKNNMSEPERKALKLYSFMVSEKLRLILIIAMIVDVLLMLLIVRPIYKMIGNVSRALILSGLSAVALSYAIKYFVLNLTKKEINPEMVLKLGIITAVFGILISIIYKLMTKYYIKEEENEVSKLSKE